MDHGLGGLGTRRGHEHSVPQLVEGHGYEAHEDQERGFIEDV